MATIRIDGTAGNDTINENYYDDEIIYTYGGNDVVNLWVNDDYAGGQYVDTGDGNDTINQAAFGWGEFHLGNGNDTFISNGDDFTHGNYVDGGAGNDSMVFDTWQSTYLGGDGNDAFYSTSHHNYMDGGNGIDWVSYELTDNSVIVDLLNNQAGDAGDLTLHEQLFNIENVRGSIYADQLQGNNVNNRIEGMGGNDQIWGLGGADNLLGGGGNDAIAGGAVADAITGGAGIDDMWGEAGNDRFIFTAVNETGKTAATRDWIGDFTHAADKIDLSAIDANIRANATGNQAFSFIGAGAFTGAAGQLHVTHEAGNTIISGDINGDRAADFHIELQGNIALTAVDFIL